MTSFTVNKQEEIEYELLQPRLYPARLENIEERQSQQFNVKTQQMEPSDYVLWKFVITEAGSTAEGRFVWVTSSTKMGEYQGRKAKARRFIEGILGREIAEGETVQAHELLGHACMISVVVTADKEGGKRNTIESVSPPLGHVPQASTTPTPAAQAVQQGSIAPLMQPTPGPQGDGRVGYLKRWLAATNTIRKEKGVTVAYIQERLSEELGVSNTPFKDLAEIEMEVALDWAEPIAANPKNYDAELREDVQF